MDCGFYLYTSDSMEKLAAQYVAARQKQPSLFHGKDLFSSEEIIVPSKGMGKWLERCLADQGVMLANIRFISLFAFFNRMFRQEDDVFDLDPLTWRIVSVLENDTAGDFKELSTYVNGGNANESRELRRYSLASKIASLFNQYLIECPEMPAGWNSKSDSGENWQAKLWQRLCSAPDGGKTDSSADRIIALLNGDSAILDPITLPITVFGFSSMPLRQLAVLKKLSTKIPVHYFCLNPCDSLWDDDLRAQWSKGSEIKEPEKVDKLYEGTLLRQWSNHERIFFKYLTDIKKLDCCKGKRLTDRQLWQSSSDAVLQKRFSDNKKNVEHGPNGTLQYLQSVLRGRSSSRPDSDDSLTIHCCHNELREVEILRDHLLHLVEKHGYSNSDILVAAPDISVFVPCIEAVFSQPVKETDGTDVQAGSGIPYTINGRSIRQNNPLADALLLLLDVGRYRYELVFVEKLLNFPEIRSRFSFEEDEISVLIQYCQSAGICWGFDGDHSKYAAGRITIDAEKKYDRDFSFPDFENFSWRYGIDRLLLGLALEDDGQHIWNQTVVPCDVCDSPDGRIRLENLIRFLQALHNIDIEFAKPCPVEIWLERLKSLMETFFRCDMERKAPYRGLWDAINTVISGITRAGYTQKDIPLEVIREAISSHISIPEEKNSFLNGAVSFSNLRDIRGIPCKVLCLLGMDNTAYPRSTHPDSLNLVEKQLLDECRLVSQQDRYFFLESFLAVRDYLLIYYRGIDDASDKRYFASTLVSDLRNYAEKFFPGLKKDKKDEENGIFGTEVCHSLLPHSRLYFRKNPNPPDLRNLWSYSAANYQIAAFSNSQAENSALQIQRNSFRNFDRELEDRPIKVPLKELEDFIQNAGFTFLKKAFSFSRQKEPDKSLRDIEPVKLDNLEQWNLVNNRILPLLYEMEKIPSDLSNDELSDIYERLKAENSVPIRPFEAEFIKGLLGVAWIPDDKLRDFWKKQNSKKCAKRPLSLDFSNEVPKIPNTSQENLPGLFLDLDNIPGDHYDKVEITYETTKEKGEPYVYLTLASEKPKYKMRAFVRHLFFNAVGDSVASHIIWKDGTEKIYSPMSKDDARKKLRAILALYLYGQNHAVPFLCQCSTNSSKVDANGNLNSDGEFKWLRSYPTSGKTIGDDQLDYAAMLWARDKNELKNQEDLCRAIQDLAANVLEGVK